MAMYIVFIVTIIVTPLHLLTQAQSITPHISKQDCSVCRNAFVGCYCQGTSHNYTIICNKNAHDFWSLSLCSATAIQLVWDHPEQQPSALSEFPEMPSLRNLHLVGIPAVDFDMSKIDNLEQLHIENPRCENLPTLHYPKTVHHLVISTDAELKISDNAFLHLNSLNQLTLEGVGLKEFPVNSLELWRRIRNRKDEKIICHIKNTSIRKVPRLSQYYDVKSDIPVEPDFWSRLLFPFNRKDTSSNSECIQSSSSPTIGQPSNSESSEHDQDEISISFEPYLTSLSLPLPKANSEIITQSAVAELTQPALTELEPRPADTDSSGISKFQTDEKGSEFKDDKIEHEQALDSAPRIILPLPEANSEIITQSAVAELQQPASTELEPNPSDTDSSGISTFQTDEKASEFKDANIEREQTLDGVPRIVLESTIEHDVKTEPLHYNDDGILPKQEPIISDDRDLQLLETSLQLNMEMSPACRDDSSTALPEPWPENTGKQGQIFFNEEPHETSRISDLGSGCHETENKSTSEVDETKLSIINENEDIAKDRGSDTSILQPQYNRSSAIDEQEEISFALYQIGPEPAHSTAKPGNGTALITVIMFGVCGIALAMLVSCIRHRPRRSLLTKSKVDEEWIRAQAELSGSV